MAWKQMRWFAKMASAALLASGTAAQAEWVASWAAPPHAPLGTEGPFAAASFENVTLRQTLRLSEGGEWLRVRFTNRYGPGPLEIGSARIVLLDDAGQEIASSARFLQFDGRGKIVVPKGADWLSDAVPLKVPDFARVRVEFHLPTATGPCSCHLTGLDALEVSPAGDFVNRPFTPTSTGQYRAFLASVEVDSPVGAGTVVTFGDSITDGVGSTPAQNRRWPDVLAGRLQQAGLNYGVANLGISGNRVLQDGMGESALARFDNDVLSLPNVKYMIVFEGVNDLGMGFGFRNQQGGGPAPALFAAFQNREITADDVIAGYVQLIARARTHGIKVFGATIAPYKGASYWSDEGEAARQKINAFIRTADAFDAVLDFDKALADPADPAKMRDEFHMGDFLHGSDAGYAAVANSIDLKLFGAK
jgi:lysophospholipase L1-like esterase